MKKQNYLLIALLFAVVLFFFKPFIFEGKLPIPSDTIIGLYHPFRDLYQKEYPRGIPFKNFLITDPVRQQYPWRNLSISLEKQFKMPTWNPYSAAGTPLLANFQTGAFYQLNLLFFIFSFSSAWTIIVILQLLLGSFFMYLFLSKLKISLPAAFLGSLAFSFSGFSIAWLEWNTVGHVIIWLPLILTAKEYLLERKSIKWIFILIFAECSAILAGHLQTLFYTMIISNSYLAARIVQMSTKRDAKNLLLFAIKKYRLFFALGAIIACITAIQWLPTFQFINLSARGVDQFNNWQADGWFIPWEHLMQFIAPDFFGNPTTLNYWGTWNYAEFVGYIGILPLFMAFYAIFFRKDRKTLYFGTLFFLSLLFALPTIFAKLPFILNIPFLSTSQPTRLLFIIDFSLAILSAFGLDYFIKQEKKMKYIIAGMFIIFIAIWGFVFYGNKSFNLISMENLLVVKRNIVFPTILFATSGLLIIMYQFITKNIRKALIIFMLGLSAFDLIRFADKFTPFTQEQYLFPSTKTIEFLQKNVGNYRIMSTDSRIFPPNFSTIYRLQSVDIYDPLYLLRYGELIAASERGKPDIGQPFGFNRIITPHNFDSKIIDLLGVKYILSLADLSSPKLKKVFQEGQTRVYENKNVLPRVFFIERIYYAKDKKQTIEAMFNQDLDLGKIGILGITDPPKYKLGATPGALSAKFSMGKAKIAYYSENRIIINADNPGNFSSGFLVLTDSFYPAWSVKIDGKQAKINRVDYNFRGVGVPEGKHTIEFYNSLL